MSDNVKNPSYYNRGKIEVWEFIEDQDLDYHTGNAVKYIVRAGYKDPSKEVEDLQKAIAFLERKIKVLTGKIGTNGTTDTTDMNIKITTFKDYTNTLTAEQHKFIENTFNEFANEVSEAIEKYKQKETLYLEKECIKWFYSMVAYANLIQCEQVYKKIEGFHKELLAFGILK